MSPSEKDSPLDESVRRTMFSDLVCGPQAMRGLGGVWSCRRWRSRTRWTSDQLECDFVGHEKILLLSERCRPVR